MTLFLNTNLKRRAISILVIYPHLTHCSPGQYTQVLQLMLQQRSKNNAATTRRTKHRKYAQGWHTLRQISCKPSLLMRTFKSTLDIRVCQLVSVLMMTCDTNCFFFKLKYLFITFPLLI